MIIKIRTRMRRIRVNIRIRVRIIDAGTLNEREIVHMKCRTEESKSRDHPLIAAKDTIKQYTEI